MELSLQMFDKNKIKAYNNDSRETGDKNKKNYPIQMDINHSRNNLHTIIC